MCFLGMQHFPAHLGYIMQKTLNESIQELGTTVEVGKDNEEDNLLTDRQDE